MKKKKIILIGAAVAAVVVIGIGAWTLFGRKHRMEVRKNVVYVNSVANLMIREVVTGQLNRFAGVVRNTETGGHSAESG